MAIHYPTGGKDFNYFIHGGTSSYGGGGFVMGGGGEGGHLGHHDPSYQYRERTESVMLRYYNTELQFGIMIGNERLIPDLSHLRYQERFEAMKLPMLQYWRYRGDMIANKETISYFLHFQQ